MIASERLRGRACSSARGLSVADEASANRAGSLPDALS